MTITHKVSREEYVFPTKAISGPKAKSNAIWRCSLEYGFRPDEDTYEMDPQLK